MKTDRDDELAALFERHRAHLRAVAYRMLGTPSEADDAVQEAWLRLDRAGDDAVNDLRAWLTTVVARICLDQLRARKARREEALDAGAPEAGPPGAAAPDPEREALLADAVGPALMVVLATLSPAERIAFVLHDTFGVSFEEIARIVGRTPDAARQLASRARRRVQGVGGVPEADAAPAPAERQQARAVVAAFLAASRTGELGALLAVLDPGVVVRADAAAAAMGAEAEVRGAEAVAKTFLGRARGAQAANVDGVPGAVWMGGGRPRVVFDFTVAGDKIVALTLRADPTYLAEVDLELGLGED
jgi:RNA polymerase sigma factor (sigma-70 family)